MSKHKNLAQKGEKSGVYICWRKAWGEFAADPKSIGPRIDDDHMPRIWKTSVETEGEKKPFGTVD